MEAGPSTHCLRTYALRPHGNGDHLRVQEDVQVGACYGGAELVRRPQKWWCKCVVCMGVVVGSAGRVGLAVDKAATIHGG